MEFAKSKKTTWPTYWRLWAYLKPYWWIGLIGLCGTALYSGIDAGVVYLLKPLLNKGFIAQDQQFIHQVPYLTVFAFTLRGLVSSLSSYCMTLVARSVVTTLRQQLFGHYLKLSAGFYDQITSGKLLSKLLYDAEQVAQVSMDTLRIFVQSLCLAIGLFVVMLTINWRLTVLYVLVLPFIALIVKVANRLIRRSSHKVQHTMGQVTEIAEESIEGYQVVRLFNGEGYETKKFNQVSFLAQRQMMKVALVKNINVFGVQFIASFGVATTIYYAITPSSTMLLDPGSFSAFLAAILAILKPLKNIATVNGSIQRGLAGAQSIFAMLDTPLEKETGTRALHTCQGAIAYKAVHFAYQKQTILEDINLHIKPGEKVALVGRSGSGKTTLAHLLPRFYEPSQGCIEIDDIDIRTLTRASLRQHMALVGQHVTLFNDTVAKNIAYGATSVDQQQLERAATRAYAMEFIGKLPEGFDTKIGENGFLLSGGQRQRIAIARAIYKNAPILILDEATSALDTESERYIQAALHDIMQQRTTLIIAHRLSTIEQVDRIVVLDRGKIVETGTHQSLLKHNGLYKQLYILQSSEPPEQLPATSVEAYG